MTIKLKETVDMEILEGKFILFDSEESKFIEMNDLGRVIIEDIKENGCFNEHKIVEKIVANYECECDKKEIYEDVNNFVNDLKEIGILTAV